MTDVYAVDANAAVKLYLNEPLADEAANLFALLAGTPPAVFHVPDLFHVECANIFVKQVKRGNCTAAQATAFLTALRSLPLVRTATFELSADALALSLAHGISAYDACYVALANRHAVTLLTADERLVRKMAGTASSVVWLGTWKPPAPTSPSPTP